MAGGANFPDKKPWEGGAKVWHDDIFVLATSDARWRHAGRLPRPLAYGVCATYSDGLVCVGGSDAERHYSDAFRLEWREGHIVTSELPPLPRPVANASGALVGNTLYVVGGQASPDSTTALDSVWRVDLSAKDAAWRDVGPYPGGGRILSVAAGGGGKLWVVGGAELVAGDDKKARRRYHRDGYSYEPAQGWKRIADLPTPTVAAPSPAPSDAAGFYVLGGDDGSQLDAPPERHRGFSNKIWRYSTADDRWREAGKLAAPRVTAPCVRWNKAWIVPSGERRPGIRSPEVWSWTPRSEAETPSVDEPSKPPRPVMPSNREPRR